MMDNTNHLQICTDRDLDCASHLCSFTALHLDGNVHTLNRNLQLQSFKAYELRVTHLYQLKQHNLIVSVGEDELGVNPVVSTEHDALEVPITESVGRWTGRTIDGTSILVF